MEGLQRLLKEPRVIEAQPDLVVALRWPQRVHELIKAIKPIGVSFPHKVLSMGVKGADKKRNASKARQVLLQPRLRPTKQIPNVAQLLGEDGVSLVKNMPQLNDGRVLLVKWRIGLDVVVLFLEDGNLVKYIGDVAI